MSNYTSDDLNPIIQGHACFSHWFGRQSPKEYASVWLYDDSRTAKFWFKDFFENMIPEETQRHIKIEEAAIGLYTDNYKDGYSSPAKSLSHSHNVFFEENKSLWPFCVTFDLTKIDAKSLFFAVTAARYPQEMPVICKEYKAMRQRRPNLSRELALLLVKDTSDSDAIPYPGHTLMMPCLYWDEGDDSKLLNLSFKDKWPKLGKKPYAIADLDDKFKAKVVHHTLGVGYLQYGDFTQQGKKFSERLKRILNEDN
jgi:hypothetical protein